MFLSRQAQEAPSKPLSTNLSASASTQQRAEGAAITLVPTDVDLVAQSDYIVSIVPPRDAVATAERIIAAQKSKPRPSGSLPLYYLDLNAIAPSTARDIGARFAKLEEIIRLVDGGIIGGPPKPGATPEDKWSRPSIVLSGPFPLSEAPKSGSHLAEVLRTKNVGPDVGTASGLKCCYASLTKGFTALAIQSFSTAAQLGVLDELREEIRDSNPSSEARAVRGLTSMPPKSGRWVAEMQEIGKTFREAGGWEGAPRSGGPPGSIFEEIAEVYRYISDETVLGQEKGESRARGKTAEDVVAAIIESKKQ
jgi:3-hydroxyisobutyrate dehydrogenase-like beta-hydroxyacid dehydrogenase